MTNKTEQKDKISLTNEELQQEKIEHMEESKIPEIAQKKLSKFGPGQFQNGSRFWKWNTNFSPMNKQRPGRAAGRGR